MTDRAAPPGGFFPAGQRVLLVDSITESVGHGAGCVAISGSHGGLSAGRFALQAGVWLAVFNDAGIGKDDAGIAALTLLQAQGVAAIAVSHASARIGEARSTWQDGEISAVNATAEAMGARPGMRLCRWLREQGAAEPCLIES